MAHPQIAAFARLANGVTVANRLIAGQQTRLARTMHDIRYDAAHDEFVVPNQFAQAILTFRGGADGEEAPIRTIQGPRTQLMRPDRLDVDSVHNEIFVPDRDRVLVFPRDAHGDVSPIRVLMGSSTKIQRTSALAVDPANNVLVVQSHVDGDRYDSLLIFDRTAAGDTAPLRMIRGPKTEIIRINQIQIYSPRGWIVATQPGVSDKQEPAGAFIGIWSIHDDGNVGPRWRIDAGPDKILKKPRGVTLNPGNKEIIVADMRLNAVLTYYFPEIF